MTPPTRRCSPRAWFAPRAIGRRRSTPRSPSSWPPTTRVPSSSSSSTRRWRAATRASPTEDDIEPWLGERAGFFLETFTEEADGAAVVATTDPPAAEQAIEKAAAADEEPERRRSYRGRRLPAWIGAARPRAWSATSLVAGTENAFRDAVDASKGRSLAESGDFKAQLDQAPDDRVGFALRSSPRAILDALQKSGLVSRGRGVVGGPPARGRCSAQPVTASVSATSDQLALQASAAPAPPRLSQESPLLRDFPEDVVARLRGHRRRRGLRAAARPGPARRGSRRREARRRARLRPRRPDQPLGRGPRRVRGRDVAVRPRRGAGGRDRATSRPRRQTLDQLRRALGNDPR